MRAPRAHGVRLYTTRARAGCAHAFVEQHWLSLLQYNHVHGPKSFTASTAIAAPADTNADTNAAAW